MSREFGISRPTLYETLYETRATACAVLEAHVKESEGDPVLAAVDLDSGYLFDLSLRENRSGADWAEVLSTICYATQSLLSSAKGNSKIRA